MLYTAGKITITATLTGVFIFALAFLFNVGHDQIRYAIAQSPATTTLTVLNVPPAWVVEAYEFTGASTNSPINSGETMEWRAVATNDKDYWLIICRNDTPPEPTNAANFSDQGNPANAPTCFNDEVWAVSGPTSSGDEAIATVLTTESAPFQEANSWWGWVCDDDEENPRCNDTFSQGLNATNSSPFVVNFRPILDSVSNDGPTLPGEIITFNSTSTDNDTIRDPLGDDIFLHICSTNAFSNGACTGDTLASSTAAVKDNASASFEIFIPTPVYEYTAYAFLVDQFDHEALNNFQVNFEVANATPVISTSTLLFASSTLEISLSAEENGPYAFDFEVLDNNSCIALDQSTGDSLGPGSQFQDVIVSVYREEVGETTAKNNCTEASDYDPNNCYTSTVGTSVWNYLCTPRLSSCSDDWDATETVDMGMFYDCEFTLWHIADPTEGDSTQVFYHDHEWYVAVSVVDVYNATSSFTHNPSGGVDVTSLASFDLAVAEIPYGQLEVGSNTNTLIATTTLVATGNTGVDTELAGSPMCPEFASTGVCSGAATSTIPVDSQEYGLSSTISYGSGTALSSIATLLSIGVPKSTATTSSLFAAGDVYWGIGVPGIITQSGAYTGQNEFGVEPSPPATWGL